MFTDANTAEKANKVFRRFIKQLSVEYTDLNIEPYHKSGFVCTFSTPLTATQWSEIILESLSKAQLVGRGWELTGSIISELDAWSNESSISGVQNIHVVVEANA